MKIAWFAFFNDGKHPRSEITEAEHRRVLDIVGSTPGLSKGLVFTPMHLTDLYFDDGAPPQLGLELYFDDIALLENALSESGHLQALAAPDTLPSLAGADVTEQAMLARPFPVPDPDFKTPAGQPHCSYLVHYPGQAEDLNAWLTYYLASHTRIMATFPDIRQVEVCTRIDWCSAMPWRRVQHMQRNKVVYDDGDALKTAQNSTVLKNMRADFHKFPPFTGNNIHHPMATIAVEGV